jgi:PAS domain S-box-containing protein
MQEWRVMVVLCRAMEVELTTGKKSNQDSRAEIESLRRRVADLASVAARADALSEELKLCRERCERLMQARFQAISFVENAPVGIVIQGRGGVIYSWNRMGRELCGDHADSVVSPEGRFGNWTTLHPDGSPWPMHDHPALLTLRSGIILREVIMRLRREDGSERWISINTQPVFEENSPGPDLVISTFQDITEARHAAEELRISEERFRAILDDLGMVAVQGYDQNRRVTFWNKASTQLYGYSQAEALGQRLEDLIIPEGMRAEVVAAVERWKTQGERIPDGQLELRGKDGRSVCVYSSHVMQERVDGSREMFCVDVDFSEIRAAHAKLMQAKEDAEAANRAKSVFLANMSHEIRTPINGILGMLQLMQTTPLDAEQQDCLRIAIGSTTRLTGLLSDILDLSSIEVGKVTIREAPFDLTEVQASILDLLGLAARKKGLDLQFVIDPRLPRQLIGDETRLRQILFNLVGNAIKFTNEGHVRVESILLPHGKAERQRVLFNVSDTGVGIPDDRLRDIFEPFVQGEDSYVRSHQGAGLGLAIVKRLVGRMGGTLSIESSPQGTTICFSLPFTVSPLVQGAEAVPIMNGSASVKKTILVAEDDAVSLLVVSRILEKAGFAVLTATDGQRALDLARTVDVDLILLDVQMPALDGLEVARRIRGDAALGSRSTVPIVAMTAYSMAGDREIFLAAGMNDYLAKPFIPADLFGALARAGLCPPRKP